MKRFLFLLLILAMLCAGSALAESANADAAQETIFTCGDYEYVLQSDGGAEVTRYTGKSGTIVIPNDLDGHPILGMRDNVFGIQIPTGATANEAYSFSVDQSHPCLAVVNGVLFGKSDHKLICYPPSLRDLSYDIPQGTERIGDHAFTGIGLGAITIPDGVTSIGAYAFSVNAMTDMHIPDSVTSIGEGAFSDCMQLSSVNLPASITSIPDCAFYSCNLHSYTIPDNITSIGMGAFSCCYNLTSVTIPESVTSIGEAAFYGCTGLTAVSIPDSVTSIGDGAFEGCTGLTAVTIPDSVTSIGRSAFSGCPGLTTISIPGSVTSIGYRAFSGCTNLTLSVPAGSYAETYCQENNLNYTTYDPTLQDAPTDWLTGA